MTVKELIERLSVEDPHLRVVVQGYETGYDELEKIRFVQITANPSKNEKRWEGEFDEAELVTENTEVALCFFRKSY
jgi:hypothetical protein